MDNTKVEENKFPKRTDKKYRRIEGFKPYELTHCVVFEMASRNKEVKRSIEILCMLEIILKVKFKLKSDDTNENIEELNECDEHIMEVSIKDYERLNPKRNEFLKAYNKGIKSLKNEFHIHYDQNSVHLPEIEDPLKKDISEMSPEQMEEEVNTALASPMVAHISGGIGEYLHGDKFEEYKSNNNCFDGFVVNRGIKQKTHTFNISSINPHFQRKIFDTNQTNVAINMSLPENEIIEYIKHIKKSLSNSNKLKTPNALLGKNVQEVEKTANYPKKPTAEKLADMFFVYDYITAKLKEYEDYEVELKESYDKNLQSIKNNYEYTTAEKKEQYKILKKEYDENRIFIKIDDIFKDFDNKFEPIENITFRSSTASNYYYAIKPYIEELRYSELLTGETIIKEENYSESR